MSADTLTQILGITGAITGVLALIVSYRTYTSAKPKLKVTVKKCEHLYEKGVEKTNDKIIINSQLSINNSGDRGTTLNEIEAKFMQDGKEYRFKKEIGEQVIDDDTGEILGETKVSIRSHETIDKWVFFEGLIKGTQQGEIECQFKLFHTHGSCSFSATSKRMSTYSERV